MTAAITTQSNTSKSNNRIMSAVLHHIDVISKKISPITITGQQLDLEGYLTDLLGEVKTKQQKREYDFSRTTTEFYSALISYHGQQDLQLNTTSSGLANRLLDKEVATDARYGHLGTDGKGHVKKGSFLQFLYTEDDGSVAYLGVKIEHQTFIDEMDLKKKIGLSIANKIYKACRVNFDENKIPSKVFVYDTNAKPSTYWWHDFLELKELRNDALNTQTASKAIIRVINAIKKNHPTDHTILRNSIVSSFKQNSVFDYYDFLEKTIENYEPEDAALKEAMPKIIKTLKELPEKANFDTQFSLVPSAVPFRKTKYNLSKEIFITIEDGIENLSDKIWSERTASGKELVIIESPEGFKQFTQKDREL